MNSAQELFDSCLLGKFPRLSILVDFGLDGRDGINPVELFERYRKHSVTNLHQALVNDTLEKLVGLKVKSGYNTRYEVADSHVLLGHE